VDPVLIACSHGTASAEGRRAVTGLVAAVARRRPDLVVRAAYVDVQEPTPTEVLTEVLREVGGRQARLVPLLLSAGYHVFVDLTEAAATTPTASVSPALGPDDRLAELLRDRLEQSGLRPRDRVVLAAAGSSEPSAVADCAAVAAALGRLVDRPVTTAYLSAAQPRVRDAVAALRQTPGRVAVATYLLAPGFFADLAARAGADLVTAPLLLPEEPPAEPLVDIVLERYGQDAVTSPRGVGG
jgi:sirohydrochlorin ferrochelatase